MENEPDFRSARTPGGTPGSRSATTGAISFLELCRSGRVLRAGIPCCASGRFHGQAVALDSSICRCATWRWSSCRRSSWLWISVLRALICCSKLHYGRPFWHSLGWVRTRPGEAREPFSYGFVLAFASRAHRGRCSARPISQTPMKELLSRPQLGAADRGIRRHAGAACEELAFRGFLQPRWCARSGRRRDRAGRHAVRPAASARSTAGSWRHGLLITLAGVGVRLDALGLRIDARPPPSCTPPTISLSSPRLFAQRRKLPDHMVETIQWTERGRGHDRPDAPAARGDATSPAATYQRSRRRHPRHGHPRRAGHRRGRGHGRRAGRAADRRPDLDAQFEKICDTLAAHAPHGRQSVLGHRPHEAAVRRLARAGRWRKSARA